MAAEATLAALDARLATSEVSALRPDVAAPKRSDPNAATLAVKMQDKSEDNTYHRCFVVARRCPGRWQPKGQRRR